MRASVFILICWLHSGVVQAAENLAVNVDRKGRGFAIEASATVPAPAALVWQVLTDYEHLASFIPGLTSSHVQARSGDRVLVEQKGEARFLFFSYPIDVRLEVLESPGAWIRSRGVGGNLRRMIGRYDLSQTSGGVLLRYGGELEPDFQLPPIIGRLAVQNMVEQQFAAMVSEIERRAGLPR